MVIETTDRPVFEDPPAANGFPEVPRLQETILGDEIRGQMVGPVSERSKLSSHLQKSCPSKAMMASEEAREEVTAEKNKVLPWADTLGLWFSREGPRASTKYFAMENASEGG